MLETIERELKNADNPEKLATIDTQDTGRKKTNNHHYTQETQIT